MLLLMLLILLGVTVKLGVEFETVEGVILFVGLSRLFFTFGYSIASPVCSFASASLNPTIGLSCSAWAPKGRIAFVTDSPELFSHPGEYGDDRGVSLLLLSSSLLHPLLYHPFAPFRQPHLIRG